MINASDCICGVVGVRIKDCGFCKKSLREAFANHRPGRPRARGAARLRLDKRA